MKIAKCVSIAAFAAASLVLVLPAAAANGARVADELNPQPLPPGPPPETRVGNAPKVSVPAPAIKSPAAAQVKPVTARSDPVLKFVEPTQGSIHPSAATRLRVVYPREFAGKTAEIWLHWEEWARGSWNIMSIVHHDENVWQVPIERLGAGIVVPPDKICDCTHPVSAAGWVDVTVKVRIAGALPEIWNDTVKFQIGRPDERPAATPATSGNWSAAAQSPANPSTTPGSAPQTPRALGTQGSFSSPSAQSKPLPPPSALQSRP